jgi:hypothetical protein
MMKAASATCGGFPIDVEEEQQRIRGLRFRDKRQDSIDLWDTIVSVLTTIGAIAA